MQKFSESINKGHRVNVLDGVGRLTDHMIKRSGDSAIFTKSSTMHSGGKDRSASFISILIVSDLPLGFLPKTIVSAELEHYIENATDNDRDIAKSINFDLYVEEKDKVSRQTSVTDAVEERTDSNLEEVPGMKQAKSKILIKLGTGYNPRSINPDLYIEEANAVLFDIAETIEQEIKRAIRTTLRS